MRCVGFLDPVIADKLKPTVRPEVNLISEIVLRALQDATRGKAPIHRQGRDTHEFPEVTSITTTECLSAISWLFADDRRPFGFLWICEHLDICPDAIREFVADYS